MLEFGDGFLQQLAVEVQADFADVAALGGAQQVAGAANLQVAHGDAEAGSQFGGLQDGLQAPLGRLGDAAAPGDQQVGVSPVLAAADAAP